jgi:hypothetical protein
VRGVTGAEEAAEGELPASSKVFLRSFLILNQCSKRALRVGSLSFLAKGGVRLMLVGQGGSYASSRRGF